MHANANAPASVFPSGVISPPSPPPPATADASSHAVVKTREAWAGAVEGEGGRVVVVVEGEEREDAQPRSMSGAAASTAYCDVLV